MCIYRAVGYRFPKPFLCLQLPRYQPSCSIIAGRALLMAYRRLFRFSFLLLLAVSLVYPTSSASSRYHKRSKWQTATATWYGSPSGAGSDGGACGYGSVAHTPYGSYVGAGSPVLFRNGKGCGSCYQVKCVVGSICSTRPVTIVITDECPGGYCAFGRTHFDLSGAAFSRMASSSGATASLRNAGVVEVLYRRVPCRYPGTPLEFQMNEGATNYWFSMLVRYEDGEGDLSAVELMDNSGQWLTMNQLWGAYWCFNGGPLSGPFSIRLSSSSGSVVTAYNAIPKDWSPGRTYIAHVNFA